MTALGPSIRDFSGDEFDMRSKHLPALALTRNYSAVHRSDLMSSAVCRQLCVVCSVSSVVYMILFSIS